MKIPRIDFNRLVSIEDHLKALVAAEEAITDLNSKLAVSTSTSAASVAWRRRASDALSLWKTDRRRVTARLAVLRQQEKECNVISHGRQNDYLVKELMKYVPKAVFLACDYRAKVKAEADHD